MSQPQGDNPDAEAERVEAERQRREQIAQALDLATLDDLFDVLTRRFIAFELAYELPAAQAGGRKLRDVAYGGGLAAARGLSEYAADELGYKMLNDDPGPAPPDDDESADDDADQADDEETDD